MHVTNDSGADGHYISEHNRMVAGLPILRNSTRRMQVADGGTSTAINVTQPPFPQLSKKATNANAFKHFPLLLMSVGIISDNGRLSIFTKD